MRSNIPPWRSPPWKTGPREELGRGRRARLWATNALALVVGFVGLDRLAFAPTRVVDTDLITACWLFSAFAGHTLSCVALDQVRRWSQRRR